MYVIKSNRKTNSYTVRKINRITKVVRVGRRGLKGDPGGGLVESVNGKQGVVVLNATDVGADPVGSASQALQDAKDYTDSEVGVVATDLSDHEADTANPHSVTKAQVGLGNVDNTSDANKPVSTATQTALGGKANSADVNAALAGKANFPSTNQSIPVRDGSGAQGSRGYGTSVIGSTIPLRSSTGTLAAANATTSSELTTKSQMDAADALKLNISDNRVELRGVGFPNGVVSAPVGTTYVDTAATNGAIEWKKATGTGNTGWVVSVGDTGWRNVLPLVNTDFLSTTVAYNNFLQIRIKNGIVELRGRLLTTRATVNEEQIFMSSTSLPDAYRSPADSGQVFTESANSTDLGTPTFGFIRDSMDDSGRVGAYTFMSGKSYSVNLKWTNNGSWPVTLP